MPWRSQLTESCREAVVGGVHGVVFLSTLAAVFGILEFLGTLLGGLGGSLGTFFGIWAPPLGTFFDFGLLGAPWVTKWIPELTFWDLGWLLVFILGGFWKSGWALGGHLGAFWWLLGGLWLFFVGFVLESVKL